MQPQSVPPSPFVRHAVPLGDIRILCNALRNLAAEEPSREDWDRLNDRIEDMLSASRRERDDVITWLRRRTGTLLFLCDCCEAWREETRGHRLGDHHVCEPCWSTHSLCEDCDTLVHDDDGRSVCEGSRFICDACASGYRLCATCDYEGHLESMNRMDGEWYCDDHVPSDDDSEDGDGVMAHEADVLQELLGTPWLAQPEEITDRHGNRKSKAPTLWMGFELEVVARDRRSHAVQAVLDALSGRGIVKNDGSIPDDGFEIVSLPATLAYHQAGWGDRFFSILAAHVRGWDEKCCGMHVHMARDALTPLQIARLQVFVNGDGMSTNNRNFIEQVAGRGATEYCRHYHKQLTDCGPTIERHAPIKPVNYDEGCDCASCTIQRDAYERATVAASGSEAVRHQFRQMYHANDGRLSRLCRDRRNSDRYQAINLQSDRTIEWRIFQSNVSMLGFLKNLEFCHAAAKFCADAGNTMLHSGTFLAWIEKRRGEYPNFVRWAVREKLLARRHADAPGAAPATIAA